MAGELAGGCDDLVVRQSRKMPGNCLMGIFEFLVARSRSWTVGRCRVFCSARDGGDAKRVTGCFDAQPCRLQHRLRDRERIAAAHGLSLLRHFRSEGLGLRFRSIEDRANEIDDELPWSLVVIVNNKLQIDCVGWSTVQWSCSLFRASVGQQYVRHVA
ncbi:hypothetical protein ABID26_006935 [Mesorhizobium shonense]|uniref:Uncharacterized protein n=1 Tax=Mesorhizobium shonense TaxID=1209948 RepID=A0ABV2I3M1_9HYPH